MACLGKIRFLSCGLKCSQPIFDHQYPRKELVSTVDFLHGDNHQERVGSETATFGWVWPVVSLVQSDCRIL